jgi:acetylornithine aminotransferase/acetylornithine/N-succinyldiaminopimelate aminotransferase
VEPDIMTLAKALGNGLPIGAMLARREVAGSFAPGDHASTFGGNPVACAAALAVMKIMLADGFLPAVKKKGQYLADRLLAVAGKFPDLASGVRGMGLIQGLVLTERGAARGGDMVKGLLEKGVLANFAGGVALRFIPPLIVSEGEIDTMVRCLEEVFA